MISGHCSAGLYCGFNVMALWCSVMLLWSSVVRSCAFVLIYAASEPYGDCCCCCCLTINSRLSHVCVGLQQMGTACHPLQLGSRLMMMTSLVMLAPTMSANYQRLAHRSSAACYATAPQHAWHPWLSSACSCPCRLPQGPLSTCSGVWSSCL